MQTPILRRPRSLASSVKPVLVLSALCGSLLVAWGVYQQNAMEVARKHGERPNPWRGLLGCIHLNDHQSGGQAYWALSAGSHLACGPSGDAADQPLVGQDSALITALTSITREPASSLPVAKDGTVAPQVQPFGEKRVAQGQDVTITLDAMRQPMAQQLAECMTASSATGCEPFASHGRTPAWPARYEGAAARMLTLVDIDIASGAVRAMASAHSPCYAQYWSAGAIQATGDCPTMPALRTAQAWRLDNHALYSTAMPGSIDKPWLMLTLLRSTEGAALQQGTGKAWVLKTLKTSDSVALFNRLLCADKGFAADCNRIQGLAQAAEDLGFNGGEQDLLPTAKASLSVPNGRFMMHSTPQGWAWMPARMPEADLLRRCSANQWSECPGQAAADLLAELWGQGNSQATSLSAAHMVSRLGAAANGQRLASAHLLEAVGDQKVAPAPQKVPIARSHAALIAEGMSLTHQSGGTAHAACAEVLGAATCNRITWVAGKTGTPAFSHDRLTLGERAAKCDAIQDQLRALDMQGKKPQPRLVADNVRCHMQPYKWYVALIKASAAPGAPYTRAIAVLAERNWRLDGRVDSAGDRGVNVAAEMAFRYIARTVATSAQGARS